MIDFCLFLLVKSVLKNIQVKKWLVINVTTVDNHYANDLMNESLEIVGVEIVWIVCSED